LPDHFENKPPIRYRAAQRYGSLVVAASAPQPPTTAMNTTNPSGEPLLPLVITAPIATLADVPCTDDDPWKKINFSRCKSRKNVL